MISRIGFLAWNEIRVFLRSRASWIWLFAMPVFFMYFTGKMSGGESVRVRANGTPPKDPIVLFAAHPGPVTEALSGYLEKVDYRVLLNPAPADTGRGNVALLLPEDFEARVAAGQKSEVIFRPREAGELSGRLDQARVQRAIIRTLGDLAVLAAADSAVKRSGFVRLAERLPAVRLEVMAAGSARYIPSGFSQSVPGTLVMFVMLVLLTSGTAQLFADRSLGLLRRLASSSLRRGEIVASRIASRAALAMVQSVFAVLVGAFAFKIEWGPNLGAVLLVLLCYALAVAAFAILLGSLARSAGQAIGLGVILSIVMGALGGCWWPIEIVPPGMRAISLFLPTGWAMQGLHRLMELGRSPVSALPSIAALLLFALVFGTMGVRRFRFD